MERPRILYALTPFSGPSGGVRALFDHVSVLRRHGHDAYVFAPDFDTVQRDFDNDAPILFGPGLALSRSDIVVRPETSFADGIRQIGDRLGQILFVQNHFYLRHCLGPHRRFADLGIEAVICGSRGIQRFLAEHYATPGATVIPYAVSAAVNAPPAKQLVVATMPRKRREELAMIHHLLGVMRPDLADIPWVEIDDTGHDKALGILAQSSVFLSLQRFEGFGLPALEAMASGCLVAGFTGVPTSDYARPDNGWWAADDDIEGAARALASALTAARDGTPAAAAKIAAGHATVAAYSTAARDAALLEFYNAFTATSASRTAMV